MTLTVRPFSTTTPRPPLWHFHLLAASSAMWGAGPIALLVVFTRDTEAAVPKGDGEDDPKGERWETMVFMAGVSGLFALYVSSPPLFRSPFVALAVHPLIQSLEALTGRVRVVSAVCASGITLRGCAWA
ncbi:hypothetical protein IMZ48_30865, partial [Candidatus Bathyarchaeota archaeon]|nr:hypothetical protein [Candidatus Bathyarchaeota archaeon]